ncbi:MAG: 2'-5' RNA ligase family protein [Hamadaea sp.]|nr:2'-5' RNA ligase family protein [Hamadaea sp.]
MTAPPAGFRQTGAVTEESALIVAVPETEPAVGAHRARLDRAAGWGVPAHVTVLYPFMPPRLITADVIDELAALFTALPRFAADFTEVRWFADDVVYLAPTSDRPFRELTEVVWRRFPRFPPYGGAFDDVVPHLTIGHDHPRETLLAAATAVTAKLPIRASIHSVQLIGGTAEQNSWTTIHEFPLG